MASWRGAWGLALLGTLAGCGGRSLVADAAPQGSGGASAGGAGSGGTGGAGSGGTGGAGSGGTGTGVGGTGGTLDPDAGSPVTCFPPVDPQAPIELLRETGCRSPSSLRLFAPGAVPYAVNFPASGKFRGRAFVLPAGGKIRVKVCADNPSDCPHGSADDGKWVFPVGTLVMQDVGDYVFLETRFLVRVADGSWVGYSYRWNQDQNEAALASDERTPVSIVFAEGTSSGVIPSRQDCTACHNAEAGWTLGLETAQLNLKDGYTDVEQLDRIAALGVFEVAPPKPYKAPLPRANPSGPPDTTPAEDLARSYLHANCAFCHRAGGSYPRFDLRFDVPSSVRAICNAPAMVEYRVGFPAVEVILAPGDPSRSNLIWAREAWTHVLCAGSTSCAYAYSLGGDPWSYGQRLLTRWIESIQSCP